ncbi:MAG: beta-lactamase family protein [Acetobacteraceae bacterium]|nr:beta-lactamase family protein [Acetobacteraceae bacterium]
MTQAPGLSQARLERIPKVMRDYVSRGEVAGMVALVCRHDELHVATLGVRDLVSKAPMQRDTIFRIASMTKPITAVAAMILVEEAKLRLDEPLDRFLPELANRKVLRSIESQLDDTVPAKRPLTLRDLLTFRLGVGAVMAPPGRYSVQAAMADAGLAPGPNPVPFSPDEFMVRIARLPLMHQPGEKWMYHTGSDILGVLIARASGMAFEAFLADRIFAPLGMKDTAFFVPDSKIDRLATAYQTDVTTGQLTVYDTAYGGQWSRPPTFPSGGGGLVSTIDDYLAFGRMMLNFGKYDGGRILARPTVELMIADHLTPEQKAASPFFPGFWDSRGWGFGVAVVTRRDGIAATPGQYGWVGGFGTTWCSDPHDDMVTILLMQRLMRGPDDMAINQDFLTLAYQAIDD